MQCRSQVTDWLFNPNVNSIKSIRFFSNIVTNMRNFLYYLNIKISPAHSHLNISLLIQTQIVNYYLQFV